jgi:nitrite reductase/ring-hydroxylating ferredoxin subunit
LLKTAGLQRRAVDDPEVRLLFDLYDLGEGGDQARAQAVLESLRPSLEATGATLQLLEADAHSVRVRLFEPPIHADDVRAALEKTLYERLPGVSRVEIVAGHSPPPPPASNFVPLTKLVRPRAPDWQPALPLAELAVGGLRGIDVEGVRVLLARARSGEVYAYRNECPGTPFPLDAAPIHDDVLLCPWHGCRFMLHGGRRVDAEAPGLGVLPVRVEEGQIMVAIQATSRVST